MIRHWWLVTLNQQQRCKTIRAVTKTNLNSALFFLPPGSFDQNSKPLTCMEWSLFTQGHPLPLFRQGDVLLVFHVPSVLNFAGSTTGIFKSAWMFIFCTYLYRVAREPSATKQWHQRTVCHWLGREQTHWMSHGNDLFKRIKLTSFLNLGMRDEVQAFL